MTDITKNPAFRYRTAETVDEDAYRSVAATVANIVAGGTAGRKAVEGQLKAQVEDPYRTFMFGWIDTEGLPKWAGPFDAKGEWKYDAFFMPLEYEAVLAEHGCKVLGRERKTRNHPECLKVECLPNGYKSAASVLLTAVEHGAHPDSLATLAKGQLHRWNREQATPVDANPQTMLTLALRIDKQARANPTLFGPAREVLTKLIGDLA